MTRRDLWLTLPFSPLPSPLRPAGWAIGFVFDDRPIVVDNFRVHTLVALLAFLRRTVLAS
jgi:hypothetical protein